jgi:SAM-dependent MidA family methyltransferase
MMEGFLPTEGTMPDPTLAARLRDLIRARGPITFAEFMEAALYDPGEGFYSRSPVGERGDFVTSPHVSPAFGVLVARQIEEFWTLLEKPDPFWIIEAGAGDGTLASQILEFLPAAMRPATRYVAVERSAAGRAALERLDVSVVDGIEHVHAGVVGCVVANELLDNLPFHRVRGTAAGPVELYVGVRGDRFVMVEGDVSSGRVRRLASDLAAGQDAVVQPDALGFADHATALLERGYLWLIDYGFSGGERPTGPHAYRGHRLEDDVLSDPGSRDITAGVDFEALAWHLRAGGHTVWGPVTQRQSLISLGYRQLDDDARRRQLQEAANRNGIVATRIYSARGRASALIDPSGLGGFLALSVGVRVDVPPSSVER